MRAYHRVDPLMDERKGHYTPAQFGAFLKVQLLAGRQTNRGRFRSIAALKNLLPTSYVRFVDFLVDEGDLAVLTDGTVYVDGWDEWQEGDLTVKDRMARLRNRQRNGGVTSAVTPTVTSTVTGASPTAYANASASAESVGEGSGEGLAERAWSEATGRSLLGSGAWPLEYVTDAVGRHGDAKVAEAIRRVRAGFPHVPQTNALCAGVQKVLDPFPDAKKLAAVEREQEQAVASRRGVEATLRSMHWQHAEPHPRCPACQETAA